MPRILVSVMPVAGHVTPIAGVVGALVERGHDVTVHTSAQHAGRFEALRASTIDWTGMPADDMRSLQAAGREHARRGTRGMLRDVERVLIRTAADQASDLLRANAAQGFDGVVGDVAAIGASLMAECTGIAWASVSVWPLTLPSIDTPPGGLGLTPGHGGIGRLRDGTLRGAMRVLTPSLDKAWHETRAELGLRADGHVESAMHSRELIVATGAPSLEFPRTDMPPQVRFVGRLAAPERRVIAPPSWWGAVLDTERPVVVVMGGCGGELAKAAIAALADERAFVVAIGDVADVDRLPDNVRMSPYVDLALLLPQASAVVTTGAWGEVLDALQHRVPVVIAGGGTAGGWDQGRAGAEVAARVRFAGAGVDLGSGEVKSESIRRAVRRVLGEPGFATRAAIVGAEIDSLGGSQRAAELIEELVIH